MATLPALSIQLYTVREQLAADLPGTLAKLAAIGLTRIEPYNFMANPSGLKAALAGSALTAPTAHQNVADVDDLGAVFDTAADLGIETVFEPMVPAARWSTTDGVKALADQLAAAADLASVRGMRVGYHNHAWEFQNSADGRPAYEAFVELLDPAVMLELDCYWAAVAGQDVPALLGRLGPRVIALHLKDGPVGGTTADQVPLGQGDVPFPQIASAAMALEYPVLEFDLYAGDIFEGVAASYAYATDVLGARR
jgi:sugar phosphate isomerase/epimerase